MKQVDFSLSGWLFSIYGGTFLVFFLGFNNFIVSKVSVLPFPIHIFIYCVITLNFLTLLCGIYLLKENENVHKVTLPIAFFILLSFPLGTLVGGVYLYQRSQARL